ncbi:MAG TPA: hypothetical protein VEX68_19095, partial [Bryobacteraceae bacterium]|nr:hypothetical protein [Bryobacteraceae bacterium]
MKYVLLLAGLSSCLLADPGVQGPSLGYISTAGAVRKVLGLAGAAQLSNPLVADLQQAVVLPGKSIAAAVDASGLLVRIDLTDGTVSSLGISEVTWITPSPSGETFVAVSGGRAYIFAKSGERRSDVALPGDPLMIAVSDRELNV